MVRGMQGCVWSLMGKGCRKEVGASYLALSCPVIYTQVDLQNATKLMFTSLNYVLAVACLSFCCVIRGFYREVWIMGEEAKKIPKSKNKAEEEGVRHKLARAEGLALILLSTSVFIQRPWIQVNFLCSIFIAVLLVLNWNNEHFVDRVKSLSRFTRSPASLSLSADFKQFILISDFQPSVVNCCCATSSNTWGTIVHLFRVGGAGSRALSVCETQPPLMILHLADSEQDKHFKGEGKYQIGYFFPQKRL